MKHPVDEIRSMSNITPYMETREKLTKLTGKRAALIHMEDERVARITGVILGFVLNEDAIKADEVLIDEHNQCNPEKPGWKGQSIKINAVYEIIPEEDEPIQPNDDREQHISDNSDTSKDEEEEKPPQVQKIEPKGTPTRMKSPQAQTTKVASPTVHKRTAQGWKEDPTSPIATYADKAKRAKHPLDIIFQMTPLGNVFPTEPRKEIEKRK